MPLNAFFARTIFNMIRSSDFRICIDLIRAHYALNGHSRTIKITRKMIKMEESYWSVTCVVAQIDNKIRVYLAESDCLSKILRRSDKNNADNYILYVANKNFCFCYGTNEYINIFWKIELLSENFSNMKSQPISVALNVTQQVIHKYIEISWMNQGLHLEYIYLLRLF